MMRRITSIIDGANKKNQLTALDTKISGGGQQ
jgi:hypothetical protein